jgi:two-component system cell cycle sensor histidine kinase/response regulator CckA
MRIVNQLIRRWPAIAVGVIVAQVIAALTLKPGAAQLRYAVVVYFVIVFLATAAATVSAARSRGASRIFWAFIASSYGLLWLIDWLWVYYVLVLHQGDPFSALHSTVFFLRPVPLMVAATTYPHWKQSAQVLYRSTLNLVLLLFFWVFVYAYFVFYYRFVDLSMFRLLYTPLYSAENIFLLVVLGSLIVGSRPPWRTLYWHLFGASCLWTLSLQLQNSALTFRGYLLGGWLDVPAVAACCWLVWVPLLGMRLAPQLVETAQPATSQRKYSSFAAMLVTLAIPCIGAWEVYHGSPATEMHRFRLLIVLVSFVFMAFAFFAKEQIANRELVDAIAANLRFSEERFSKAFDSNPEGITISGIADGRYVDVNDAYLQMLDYQRSEVVGKTAHELNVWCDLEDRRRIVEELLQKGRVRGAPASFRTKSGQIREVEISAESIQIQGQSCLLAITRDVTQKKQLEQQLRQAQKMEAVGRLAGGVAHDFNNLLGVILGYSEMLAHEVASNPTLAKKVSTIKTACMRAASLTSQLLAFSRRSMLQPKVLSLNSSVSETGKMLQRLLGERVEQKMVLDPALGAVKADPGQIVQVIMNLAVNARDAMPQGGQLSIQTANVSFEKSTFRHGVLVPPGRYVLLAVSDSGVGMDAETRSHLFEPFYTTKPIGAGTGLGLATVSGIVEQSGGYILVESEAGKGTTFKIYLPRVDEAVEPSLAERAPEETTQASETVLLVEDDAVLRELIQEGLRARGFKVLVAANGVDALKASESYSGSIGVLITDVIMPQMNGPELAKSLAPRRPGIKVLYISGYTDDNLRQAPTSDDNVALIQKPFQLVDLALKLREVLGRSGESGDGVSHERIDPA